METHVLLDGLGIGESPRWHDGRLWFADWGAGEIVAADLTGHRETVAPGPARIFCFDVLPDGALVVVDGPGNRLLRIAPGTSPEPYADLSAVAAGGWNDIVVDGHGNAYVDNVGFDLMAGQEPAPGFVALVTPDGVARRVADDLRFPNGVAVTGDGRTLVVAESYAERLTAFGIAPDGGLGDRRVWAPLAGGAPDGICLDADGAAWYADVPNRRCVRVREGGKVLDVVDVDRGCFACMLGGPEGRTLFVVAAEWRGPQRMFEPPWTGRLLTVEAPAAHAGWP